MKYIRPNSLEDYFAISQGIDNRDFTIFAGGTDLIPCYEQGHLLPDTMIDIKKTS